MRYYQLTLPNSDRNFHKEVADRINNDYPGQAKLVNGYGVLWFVRISEEYWQFVRDYVQANCKIKPEADERQYVKISGSELHAG